jgi:hypothetical protein
LALPRQVISIPATLGLVFLIVKKGANVGVKALYFVIGILFVSILLFFKGKTDHSMTSEFSFLTAELRNRDSWHKREGCPLQPRTSKLSLKRRM